MGQLYWEDDYYTKKYERRNCKYIEIPVAKEY